MSGGHAPFALVVDDDAIIRLNAANILEDAGFRAYEAADVEEALIVLASSGSNIQLLFTDVQMPGQRDGFSLARECAERWPHISILVASGMVSPAKDDMPPGAIFVGKPFSAEVVLSGLVEILPEEKRPPALVERAFR